MDTGNNPGSEQNNIFDVIIIGGGPAGLSAALYSARARLKTLVLDKNPGSGALGYADRIENYPGVPEVIKGTDLLAIFRRQAESFGAEVIQQQVIGVDFSSEPKQVFTNDLAYAGRTVIIATGAMGRKPSLKGEAEFLGMGVSYCATCDAAFYKEKTVAVTGRTEEVFDEIESLARFAKKVYLITAEKEPPAEALEALRQIPQFELRPGSRITEITGDVSVNGITITGAQGDETLAVNGVFVYLHGNQPIIDFLYGALTPSPEGCILVDEHMGASIEGVYAAGDVRCKKIRQVVVSTAEGCIAALAAEQYINKKGKMASQWSHSSS